ncbi:hypothetical protein AEAC466_02310 [Asticcacaulis sp. AC466]|uniref:DUF2336 domain-containing protein n=1 Tax=Asticcacaulis sp. AC466 TaxID=1282362 RepID=UPI0003C3D4D7|nr:DUF2336 domain-containing protein [Asticcacaulis sp. AC466]ESQ86040.1 hypothetical protein AEAC466_02310 [Asticcacaulis sp. AC466]
MSTASLPAHSHNDAMAIAENGAEGRTVQPTELSSLDEVFDDMIVQPTAPKYQARHILLKRLADVVCLPESRVNAFERAVTADLLVEMLRESALPDRIRVAKRLTILAEVPNSLIRTLITDDVDVARPLIEDCESLTDADLHYCARLGTHHHHMLLAGRKDLPGLLCEFLVDTEDVRVVEALLKNQRARITQPALEATVAMSQTHVQFIPLILKRVELRPSSAYVLFWWADTETRRQILTRFGVNRDIMQDMAGDVFAMMAAEKWQDPLARKALQFIERRQRNREALERSEYTSLEAAIADAARNGMTRHMAEEISYMCGIKPATGAKLMRDQGGEGLAVLCKATGLSKKALRALWKALRRPLRTEQGEMHPHLAEVLITYDILAVDRAQTVLRYWNWSLSSALTHVMLRAISSGEDVDLESLTVPQRAAMLAFAADLKS